MDLPFRPHRKVFGGAACGRNGLEVAMGAAFDVRALTIKKLNESYAAMGRVSRWPLVHPDLCKTLLANTESAEGKRVDWAGFAE